jgi:hypothetical protein
VFDHDGGTLTSSGLLSLAAATWHENTSGQQFGQLLLSAPAGSNASFSLPPGNCIVHFANSSSVAWSNQASLTIENWNGSVAGGGHHQVAFGNNASALTSQQLSQIQFSNPSGYPSGNYPAQLLSTGELVPASGPTLQSSRIGSALVLTWPGNYQLLSSTNVTGPYTTVPGANSPWTNHFTKPREFFKLQGL